MNKKQAKTILDSNPQIEEMLKKEQLLIEIIKLADDFLNSLKPGWLAKTTGDVGALNNFYIALRQARNKGYIKN